MRADLKNCVFLRNALSLTHKPLHHENWCDIHTGVHEHAKQYYASEHHINMPLQACDSLSS